MLDYFRLGHEQWTVKKSLPAKVFYFLLGHVNSTLRMDHHHIVRTIRALSPSRGSRILDAGCGFGGCALYLARIFPSCEIVGMDINQDNIENCKFISNKYSLENTSFFAQDLDTFEVIGQYDIIYCINVLEHIRDDDRLLRRFYSALNPGGHLLVYIPTDKWRSIFRDMSDIPEYVWDLASPHKRDGYSEDELKKKVGAPGFKTAELRYVQGIWGILTQELTLLFWEHQRLNTVATLLFFPVSFPLGYVDSLVHYKSGNCILMIARKPLKN